MKSFILSDSTRTNTKGFKIDLAGGKLERFNTNPVMLSEHDHSKVIGRWDNLRIENSKLLADAVFDTDDVLGKEIARKVEKGFLKGVSMGIIILEMKQINEEWTVTQWELLEASIVSIPADSGAIVLYNENKEVLKFEDVKMSFNQHNNQIQKTMEKEIKLSQKTIESLNLTADYTPKDVELAVAEKDKRIVELEADLKKEKGSVIEEYLSGAVKAGKIQESEKANYLTLAQKDFASVKAIIDGKPEAASASLKDMEQNLTSTPAAGREGWDYLKWMKEDPKGLQKLKAENPKEFERLQATIQK